MAPFNITAATLLRYARTALLFATGLRRRHLSLGGGPIWDTGGAGQHSPVVGAIRALLSLAWRLVRWALRLALALIVPEACARWVTGVVVLQLLLGLRRAVQRRRFGGGPAGAAAAASSLAGSGGGGGAIGLKLRSAAERASARRMVARMASATTYAEWRAAASRLDAALGIDEWKRVDACDAYDPARLRQRILLYRRLRRQRDVPALMFHLRSELLRKHWGAARTVGDHLFRARVGTKALFEEYMRELEAALDAVCDGGGVGRLQQQGAANGPSTARRLAFFNETRHSFGRTALCLSGGGAFGIKHVGICKVLFEHGMLPRVISGASAGSIVAALICSRTDAELPAAFALEGLDLHFFEHLKAYGGDSDDDEENDASSAKGAGAGGGGRAEGGRPPRSPPRKWRWRRAESFLDLMSPDAANSRKRRSRSLRSDSAASSASAAGGASPGAACLASGGGTGGGTGSDTGGGGTGGGADAEEPGRLVRWLHWLRVTLPPPLGGPLGLFATAGTFASRNALLDVEVLASALRAITRGDLTFQECYERTGRILNITVTPTASGHGGDLPRLLNYLTAPHVIVWSAACASCAIPGVFAPVELLAKNEGGHVVRYYAQGQKWVDGSVECDLPMARLGELFNVNHFVVAQVNPHARLFWSGGEPTLQLAPRPFLRLLRTNVKNWVRTLAVFLNAAFTPQSRRGGENLAAAAAAAEGGDGVGGGEGTAAGGALRSTVSWLHAVGLGLVPLITQRYEPVKIFAEHFWYPFSDRTHSYGPDPHSC